MTRLVLLALIACRQDSGPPPPPPATQLPTEEVVTTEIGTVESGPLISGTLEAAHAASINARLGGTVQAIGPEIGDMVSRGTLLARIDPGPLRAAAASARAQVASAERALEVARREVERSRALVEAGAIPRRDLDQAEAQLTAQDAAVDAARAQVAATIDQLADAVVRSPMAGVVARRAVDRGDVVAAGTLLYEIIDPTSMRLAAAVPSDQVGALAPGKQVRFSVRGYPEQVFTGTITRIAPAADPTTRQIPILVEIPNRSQRLLAGLFAQGRIVSETATGVVVPRSAIDESTDPPAVFRIAGGKIERVPVTLGLRDPMRDLVVVTRGLARGDRVVRRAVASPPPGTAVTIMPAS